MGSNSDELLPDEVTMATVGSPSKRSSLAFIWQFIDKT